MPHKLEGAGLVKRTVVAATIASIVASHSAFAAQLGTNDDKTTTPIKHLIVIIGENRTFDHLFGTYIPKSGQNVWNILSEGIVDENGAPGPNFSKATQRFANDTGEYTTTPNYKNPYYFLPPPGTSGAPTQASDTAGPPFASLSVAATYDVGLYPGDLGLLLTGATGLASTHTVDTRIKNANEMLNGPFQLTGKTLPYDSYTGSPVHRFYQMWQQLDCGAVYATPWNPSGCEADLFPWVETVVSAGSNGAPRPGGYNNFEGATSMGFYNVAKGDAPYFKSLADQFTIGDNYHQAIMGGTGANHIAIGYADAIYYSDDKGNPATPPAGQIENPNPQPNTNNFYTNDGYGSTSTNEGGSYTNCADPTQPGVRSIVKYLSELKQPVSPNCQADAYYLLNNYNPGYVGNGTVDPTDDGPFTIPPVTIRHIGDALNDAKVSWRYYGENWNDYIQDPTNPLYCNICNPFLYSTQTMTNKLQREEHLQDTTDLYNDITNGVLPAVSIVKPSGLNDGHPASSKLDLFESFTKKIVTELQNQPDLWKDTAILITFDEGGGYWDSGYVQPVDYFGDGTRVPIIVVSPYAAGGKVVHNYYDHVSIDKFIERNWAVQPLTKRSRDNLPNPVMDASQPYIPTNSPAIGDLIELFDFNKS